MIATISAVAAALIAATLAVMLLIAITNYLTFPRLTPHAPAVAPFVSILVPARDEAATIGATVTTLLAQEYSGAFEIIVLDDNSTDGTARVASAAASDFLTEMRETTTADGNHRHCSFQVLAGLPLPDGWIGKAWACHQLAAIAQGSHVLFTDAGSRWNPQALDALLTCQAETRADLLTVWPTQEMVTWTERLVVPLMSLALLAYLPVWLVHNRPESSAAAANGQCLLFTRAAYDACGGHNAVRATVLEDVQMARNIKAAGCRLRMADAAGLIHMRMYTCWREVREGFAKNILAGYGDSVAALLLATVFHLAVFVLPWLWILAGHGGMRVVALGLAAAGTLVRVLTAATARQPLRDALLLPISVLLMTAIAALAIWWRWRWGGARWKGRICAR